MIFEFPFGFRDIRLPSDSSGLTFILWWSGRLHQLASRRDQACWWSVRRDDSRQGCGADYAPIQYAVLQRSAM